MGKGNTALEHMARSHSEIQRKSSTEDRAWHEELGKDLETGQEPVSDSRGRKKNRVGTKDEERRRDKLGVEGGAAKRKEDESVPISVSSWFSLLGLALHSVSLHLLSEDTDKVHTLTPTQQTTCHRGQPFTVWDTVACGTTSGPSFISSVS